MSDIVIEKVNNDIVIDNEGSASVNSEIDSIEQSLRQRLNSFAGDYFLNLREGIPYFQQVLRKNPDPIIVDSIFKKAIINTKGINKLTSFNLDIDNSTRELNLTFKAETDE